MIIFKKNYGIWYDNSHYPDELISFRELILYSSVQSNRKGMPQKIKNTKFAKGEQIAQCRKKQIMLKWKDKKDIIMVSSIHDHNTQDVTVKGATDSKKVCNDCRIQQKIRRCSLALLTFYLPARKQFYTKIFWQTHKNLSGRKHRLNYLKDLSEMIITKYAKQKNLSEDQLLGRHFPNFIPPATKRCVLCYENIFFFFKLLASV